MNSLVSIVIVVWLARLPKHRFLEGLALSLILGGAVGNLYDRLTLGYVVDFLDFHWPVEIEKINHITKGQSIVQVTHSAAENKRQRQTFKEAMFWKSRQPDNDNNAD